MADFIRRPEAHLKSHLGYVLTYPTAFGVFWKNQEISDKYGVSNWREAAQFVPYMRQGPACGEEGHTLGPHTHSPITTEGAKVTLMETQSIMEAAAHFFRWRGREEKS